MRRTPVEMLAALATAALLAAAPSSSPAATAGDVLVQLRPDAACTAAAGLQRAGAVVVAPELRLYRLRAATAARLVPRLRASRSVERVSRNRVVGTLSVVARAQDPLSPEQWWRAAVGADGLVPPGPGRPVTIVDSGIDVTHPEFAERPNTQLLNGQEPAPIGGEHGTGVASLVGAPENGVGIVGLYPQADLRSWDAAIGEGTRLTTSDIVGGIVAAAHGGPGVINLSIGGTRDSLIEQAVYHAIGSGSLIVAAAGNDGQDGNGLAYPASLPHVLTVAATTRDNQVARFSSTGPYVDLAAPGDDMIVASALSRGFRSGIAGTSFAAPLVSAAAAWVWTLRPELDVTQLFELLRRSATDIGPPGRDDSSGFGLLNVKAALAAVPPIRDPLEPNDDVDVVVPGQTFYSGVAALTTPERHTVSLTARLDRLEDPRDVYRIYIAARRTVAVTAYSSTDVDVRVLSASAIGADEGGSVQLAASARRSRGLERATVAAARRARTAFVVVSPGRSARSELSYRLTVRTRA